ncbi:MAG: NAD-dependent epimerase/dehydratase family protein [Alphaproteobacteria bacterium]
MKILVTGGGGYVGCLLVEKLLRAKHEVFVLDLFIYGEPREVFREFFNSKMLKSVKGDIRDIDLVDNLLSEVEAVIHLACISNDPSFELNKSLGKSINYDCFFPIIKKSKKKVKKFIYASSSSVYGIKNENNVTENLLLDPLTDYSKYKAKCEEILLNESGSQLSPIILRPATVCGYSLRTRFDVIVNILTNHAINNKKITIYGGLQKRPNIHIEDMTDVYLEILKQPDEIVREQIFNVGFENHTLKELALIVKKNISHDIKIEFQETDDPRSYHISSKKISEKINFLPKKNIDDAIIDLMNAFKSKCFKNSMTNPKYFNIKMLEKINLK